MSWKWRQWILLYLLVVLLMLICELSCRVAKMKPKDSCDKQRKVVTGSWGIISDGNKDYPEDSYCEWLIRANSSNQFISLKFLEMETECSYDHIYIYDGDSYSNSLIGSFSGSTVPAPITALSGAMLILLYSDTNYARQGFQAEFSVTNCPSNCSAHGICTEHRCVCDRLFSGKACDISLCPDDCGETLGRGACHQLLEPPQCICNPGFSGQSCSLPTMIGQTAANSWHMLAVEETGLTPRAYHAGMYLPSTDRYYVFGGYTFENVLGDLLAFDFNQSKWINLTEHYIRGPTPRWGHAISPYHRNFAMYGGQLSDGSLSNELWLFNAAKTEWHLEATGSHLKSPPLTKHTLTLVDDHWLYLFGGSQSDSAFSCAMYRINLNEGAQWEHVAALGGKGLDRRLVGHTAVYYPPLKSLIVYGGLAVDYARFSKLSSQMHAFHVEKRYWTRIRYPSYRTAGDGVVPLERAFHSSILVGDYMVVYGGYAHRHSHEEICYDSGIYLYHLGCHRWTSIHKLTQDFIGSRSPVAQGVFSHTMGMRHNHTLLIAGGYSGVLRGSLLAYVLPLATGSDSQRHLSSSGCSWHRNKESCLANLACGWCSRSDQGYCLERSRHKECGTTSFTAAQCLGLCPMLRDCQSCLVWGEEASGGPNTIHKNEPSAQPLCAWCVQAVQCHSVGEPPPVCWQPSNASNLSPDPLWWWDTYGTMVSSLNDCRLHDKRPGLTSLKYRYPPNFEQPDDVSFINQTTEDFHFHSEFSRERERFGGGENIARFRGFIHPLGAKPLTERLSHLQLYIGSGARAVLRLSTDSTQRHLEVVANHTSASYIRTEAHRPNNRLIFPNTSKGNKYLLDFGVHQPNTDNATVTMQLVWNAFTIRPEVITVQFLEPYRNGSCHQHDTCLACLSDADCGWCQATDSCLIRDNKGPPCFSNGDMHFLIITPEDCPRCSNYIDCSECVENKQCEWLVEEAHCIRRGRFDDAVRSQDLCPVPCYIRSNCSSCLGDPGRCAWCEESRTCFLFATYTTSFMYGRCREWMDEDRAAPRALNGKGGQCKDCSSHNDCKSCLQDLACGWCANTQNPTLGLCVAGDFGGPTGGECLRLLSDKQGNVSSLDPATWSYTVCPDVEECRLGLHNCHPNATCINTQESFTCACKQGFKGDGITKCIRTCSEDCLHGYCSESPDYKCICELGWTGPACDLNCGCHNHSTCHKGVGLCDQCQEWTQGTFCENCRPGSFGNATTETGCQKCNCNGHADDQLGFCNGTSGMCFCKDSTEGNNCQRCINGYYGDPRNGGHCFLKCEPRQVIANTSRGRFGSYPTTSHPSHCLWIISVYPVFDETVVKRPLQSGGPILKLKIHQDMKVKCPQNHVYVYDGLPTFVAHGRLKRILGTFCGVHLSEPIVVTATSGFLTVYYEHSDPSQGFNASYIKVDECETCVQGPCMGLCGKSKQFCPENCFMQLGHGFCDKEYNICNCKDGYGGADCSFLVNSSIVHWSTLFNPNFAASHLSYLLPRMGHSLLADSSRLWLFGGFSTLRGELNDMFLFDTKISRWEEVVASSKSEGPPPARHFHGAALVGGIIYVYGGLGKDGVVGDFWQFVISHRVWAQIRTLSEVPALAGLTLTPVEDRLVLIGGFSPTHGFLELMLQYNIEKRMWETLNCSGAVPVGIYGHTSVYHPETRTIYVFGGILYKVDHAMISGEMYAFHYPSRRWSSLPPDTKRNYLHLNPVPRYFHTAVLAGGNYIIIMGGRSNKSSEVLGESLIYNIKCSTWIPLHGSDITVIGDIPKPSAGLAAATIGDETYIFGGFDGQSEGHLYKLYLPSDICHLFGGNRLGCVQQLGCSHCSFSEQRINRTFCYATDGLVPSSCYNPKGASEVTPGTSCSTDWIENRDCYQYTSCSDCVAFWPAHLDARQICQWCSNCQVGRCIPAGASCEKENDCNVPQRVVTQPAFCPLRVCLASDCEKCGNLGICMWTRQVMRSSEWGHTLNIKPIFDWTCVWKTIQDASSFPVESMPPLSCPPKCSQHHNCTTCRGSAGGEGGWHECRWSEGLHECLSPNYEPLRCEGGACGAVLQGSRPVCPSPCWQHSQASHCLAHPNCGWCAFSGPQVDGRGLCMEGGILGPISGVCDPNHVVLLGKPLPANVSKWFSQSGPPFWAYLEKPPENECLNGHHTCDERHEECVDTPKGFECKCKQGYIIEGDQCKPVCSQGCMFGSCVEPDVCHCNFGYVGRNCSTQCDCNGHSKCRGVDRLSDCIECHNHTQGLQCQKCKPFFVGNPANGGKCIPCKTFCNGHTDICFSPDFLNSSISASAHSWDHLVVTDLVDLVKEGPTKEAICLNCHNNTEGESCDQCISGFFKAGETIRDGCRTCECHGHGDSCNPLNGENCICHNNTENDRQCTQKNNKNNATPCWQLQCSKCKEYFLGGPTNGHQCYRHMFLDKDYCFDPSTQEECNRKPFPLLQGRTVFFAVQPRYMNVDIRITVDLTQGGVDFYLSPKDDTFVVDVNKTTGIHFIYVDEKYGVNIARGSDEPYEFLPRDRRLRKRDTDDLVHMELPNKTEAFTSTPLILREFHADGLMSYVTITDPLEFLLVRGLQNRLVITIPQEVHDLRGTRFYMVLRGVGSSRSNITYGSLFFRQDQTRIDLFVFFSVFFSCFFLFLAICVVIWKVKQAFDIRRARRLHAAEMKHMASRPFACIFAVIEDPPDEDFEPFSYSPLNSRRKHGKYSKSTRNADDRHSIRPVGVEPTSDGFAAITTVLVQLPGGKSAPVGLGLGSALAVVRTGFTYGGNGIRAVMRRRASHVAL